MCTPEKVLNLSLISASFTSVRRDSKPPDRGCKRPFKRLPLCVSGPQGPAVTFQMERGLNGDDAQLLSSTTTALRVDQEESEADTSCNTSEQFPQHRLHSKRIETVLHALSEAASWGITSCEQIHREALFQQECISTLSLAFSPQGRRWR